MISQLIGYLDSRLAVVLDDPVRLACWGMLAGVSSMLLYGLVSPQRRLKALQRQLREVQSQLANHQDDFAAGIKLARRQLGLALQRLGFVIGPSLVSALPVIALWPALEDLYGYEAPTAGETVQVTLRPARTDLVWSPEHQGTWNSQRAAWDLRWPKANQTVSLDTLDGAPIAVISATAHMPTMTKRKPWHALFENPAGYVRDDAPIEAITIDCPLRSHFSVGPQWLRSWMMIYVGGVFLSAMAVKSVFRIN